ncbi:Hypothetical protein R9X50_00095800 [Acrodontium crateriforme]|uniref:Uncharacterized protein n=1 Tax=Acrodontium crateriforme TaxID=150365 RepID=A0AAQ3LYT8_9PEZI|nr:Hypothetical protein R9X50_00095800 [Acrodontium crateriforme]
MADLPLHPHIELPRVEIRFCTQCRWMLRAAYFGQELLSTFGTSIGEIALIPTTGGIFTVHLTVNSGEGIEMSTFLIWDRKSQGGFPETKILKQMIRNYIEPEKKLGHSDTPSAKAAAQPSTGSSILSVPSHVATKETATGVDTKQDSLVQEALSVTATPPQEVKSSDFHPVTPPIAQDPLLSEALSANMSPTDRKQAEYAFLVATQHDEQENQKDKHASTAPAVPRSDPGVTKNDDVVDEALERLKRDVAAAAPPGYKQDCEDCN